MDDAGQAPSLGAELIVLSLFATGVPALSIREDIFFFLKDFLTQSEFDESILELELLGLIDTPDEGSTYTLTPAADQLVRKLSRQLLTPNIQQQRSIEEQAENVLILTLSMLRDRDGRFSVSQPRPVPTGNETSPRPGSPPLSAESA